MLLTSDVYLCSAASQAITEWRQGSHPLELPQQLVSSPNWMDPDLLRLPLAPPLWAIPLLLLRDNHARPWGQAGALLRPVITLS